MDIKIAFKGKEITPWSGITLMIKMLDQMKYDQHLDNLPLTVQRSNRGYHPNQLVKQFMTSVWCGANKFEDCEVTRHDEVSNFISLFRQVVFNTKRKLRMKTLRYKVFAIVGYINKNR